MLGRRVVRDFLPFWYMAASPYPFRAFVSGVMGRRDQY